MGGGPAQQVHLCGDRPVQRRGVHNLVQQADLQGGGGIEGLGSGEPAAGLARADRIDHVG